MSLVMGQMLIAKLMGFKTWNIFYKCYLCVIMLLRSKFSKLLEGAKKMMHKGTKKKGGKKKGGKKKGY